MTPPASLLLVEDDDAFRATLAEVLESHGYRVVACARGEEALERLQDTDVDAVITDLVMPGLRGEAVLHHVQATFPALPVVVITAFGSVREALELTRAGAGDYLPKPFRTRELLDAVARVLAATAGARAAARQRGDGAPVPEGVVAVSPAMRAVFERVRRVAASPAPVLVTGASGVGKELVARALHGLTGGPFIPVNCGALPEHLLESELFGSMRGAYTGADRDRPGLFEAAHEGILFLDEIAELPLTLQPKLLRAMDDGVVRRLGATRGRQVRVRVVAATHARLEEAVARGHFREDLYWRLAVLHVDVPPLRSRPEDIAPLAAAFLERMAGRDGVHRRVTPEGIALLERTPWPGNVRQLANVLERAAAFAPGPLLGPAELEPALDRGRPEEALATAAAEGLTLAEVERRYILEVLARAGGNRSEAARRLGIPRRTLYRRLADYGVTG